MITSMQGDLHKYLSGFIDRLAEGEPKAIAVILSLLLRKNPLTFSLEELQSHESQLAGGLMISAEGTQVQLGWAHFIAAADLQAPVPAQPPATLEQLGEMLRDWEGSKTCH
jgi:hypothetical protein